MNVRYRHGVNKGFDGHNGGNVVVNIDRRKCWRRESNRTNKPIGDFQVAFAKTVLTIEPLDHLTDQFTGKRHFIKSPPLDSRMNFPRMTVRPAKHCIYEPRPYECIGRS